MAEHDSVSSLDKPGILHSSKRLHLLRGRLFRRQPCKLCLLRADLFQWHRDMERYGFISCKHISDECRSTATYGRFIIFVVFIKQLYEFNGHIPINIHVLLDHNLLLIEHYGLFHHNL
jgi:hypothetical protein